MCQKSLMLILCALNLQPEHKCRLSTRTHFGEPLPVIIRNGNLLEPTDNFGNIELEYGDSLILSCDGTGYIQHPNVKASVTIAAIYCESGDMFKNDEWLNASSPFSYFKCPAPPNHSSRGTNRSCFEGNEIIKVGYSVQSEFYPVYESCFNSHTLTVIYSVYTQKPYNAFYQTRVVRPYFISNGIYGSVPVESLFTPGGLKTALVQTVGPMIERYVTNTENLSRGHLAAKTDFVFAFAERATFHYVNCAPQWTGFNGGNWNTLEVDLRNHVHHKGYDTIIYTGTFGVTQLFNQFGRRVDIHLYTDKNNNPVIPVPEYYYKVVYEPTTLRGIAFVGINNPYYSPDEARAKFFCKDWCRGNTEFYWLSWHPDNAAEGYTFCCTVDDFRRTINHLPSFEVVSLLT